MAYTPTVWKDGEAPALSAENLNKMEQGIAAASSDPFGEWKYAGKIQGSTSETGLSFIPTDENMKISATFNQICIVINSLDVAIKSTSNILLYLSLQTNYADETNSSSKLAFSFNFGFNDGDIYYFPSGAKIIFNKIGIGGINIYESSYFYPIINSNTGVIMTSINQYYNKQIEKIIFYISCSESKNVLSNIDVDLYYR